MKKILLLPVVVVVVFSMCKKEKKASVATVATTPISSILATSAQSGGTISDDGGSAITKRGVCFATHAAPTLSDSLTNDGSGGGSFVSNMTSLNANTTYFARAYAINATGTAYGNEISFKTSTGLPTLTTAAATDIAPLSAKTGGNVTNDGGTVVTERGVVYSTSPNPTTSHFKVASGTGIGNFVVTLSPLASQTTYYARAYASNGSGTAYGNQIQFNSASANTVTDIDGNVYPYVSVCGKDWLAANLKTTRYKNGDAITNGHVANFNWLVNTTGAYTYPDSLLTNNIQFGKLYNLEAIRDTRGVCPAGWHVATDADWQAAEVCQGMDPAVAATNGFRCCGGLKLLEGGSSGLEIKKAGQLFVSQTTGAAKYSAFGTSGIYWTGSVSTVSPTVNRYRILAHVSAASADEIFRQSIDRGAVNSVRCVRD